MEFNNLRKMKNVVTLSNLKFKAKKGLRGEHPTLLHHQIIMTKNMLQSKSKI
jgi:hypothetical protein